MTTCWRFPCQEKYLSNLTANMQLKVAALMSAEAAETPAEAPAAETAASAEEYQKHLEEGIGTSILIYEVGSDCCSKENTYMSK